MNENTAHVEALRIIRGLILDYNLPKSYAEEDAELIDLALGDYVDMLDEEIGDDGLGMAVYE